MYINLVNRSLPLGTFDPSTITVISDFNGRRRRFAQGYIFLYRTARITAVYTGRYRRLGIYLYIYILYKYAPYPRVERHTVSNRRADCSRQRGDFRGLATTAAEVFRPLAVKILYIRIKI